MKTETISRSTIRYRKLRAAGLCSRCKTPISGDRSKCDPCLERERKRRSGEILVPSHPERFCTTPLCDLLLAKGIQIEYGSGCYKFSGNAVFMWKTKPGDTPFDALRAKKIIP